MQTLNPQIQLMHAGEEVFYILIPLAAVYMIRDLRRRAKTTESTPQEAAAAEPMWTRKRVLGSLAFFFVFGALVLVEARSSPAPEGDSPVNQSLASLATDLCAAEESAGTNPVVAADIFRQEVHGPLHELANQTSKVDRSVAGKLLEAKYEVERATGKYPPTNQLHPALIELNRQASRALSKLDLQTPSCLG